MDEPRTRNPGDRIVTAVFLALLFAPAALAVAGLARPDVDFITKTENRKPFVAPPITTGALATGGYERDLERQVADAFPLRTGLIQAYDYAKFAWLGQTTSTDVIRGRDRWLFLGMEERSYVTGKWSPRDEELARIADFYAAHARWCASRGIRHVLVIAPNKSTIYAEMAPARYRPVAPTPLDRLLPMLRARGVAAIDVRAQLREAAHRGEVYSRGDTHWNIAGAYVAYRALVAALADAGVRDHVVPAGTHVERRRGDLLALSAVGDKILDDVVVLEFPHRAVLGDAPELAAAAAAANFDMRVTTVPDPALPKAVMFGDSFGAALRELLGEDFRRMIWLQFATEKTPHFDRRIVEAEHPAVVIDELVERSLTSAAHFTQ